MPVKLSRKESLIVTADNIEGFWRSLLADAGASADLQALACEDAARLREIAATLPDRDPA